MSNCGGGCGCQGDPTRAAARDAAPTEARTPGTGLVGDRAAMTRRGLLAGSATVAAALALSACAGSEDTATGGATDSGGGSDQSESAAASESAGAGSESAGAVLATVGEFPTGGGKVVSTDAGVVVVTEPADGEYRAFNGKCPHQGCPVSEVLENTIICQCHGSVFDASTGDRLEGPAPVGLTPVDIVVQGDSIRLA